LALDDGTMTTPASVAMIQALIPIGLKAVEDALRAEVTALAGARYARDDAHPGVVRWGRQRGSIYLADQKVAITVPRVRDRLGGGERPLATYRQLQTPRSQDVGLFRRVLGGISCREYEAAAEAVPEAFGLARSSVSRRFIRASARELQRLQERRLDDAEWLVLILDGKTFAGDQLVIALGVTSTGEKRILGLVQTATENKRVIAAFLRELVSLGFPSDQPLPVVLDGPRGCGRPWRMCSATSPCNAASGTSERMSSATSGRRNRRAGGASSKRRTRTRAIATRRRPSSDCIGSSDW
jgi:transposase-like protein